MGDITDKINEAFRDYVVDGVASSGVNDVDKPAVREVGPLIESAIANVGLGSLLSVTKDTRANLDADLAFDADSVALVYADTTDANNDLYIKEGASGAGSWTLTTAFHDIVSGLFAEPLAQVQAIQSEIEVRQDEIEAFQQTASQNPVRAGSAHWPLENGEVTTGDIVFYEIPNSDDLLKNPSGGRKAVFEGESAIIFLGDPNKELYNVQRRQAPVIACDNLRDSGSRYFNFGYFGRNQLGALFDSKRDRMVAFIEQETVDGEFELAGPELSTGNFSGSGAHVIRRNASEMLIEGYEATDGTRYAGTPASIPVGWDGLDDFLRPLCIGGYRPDLFPTLAALDGPALYAGLNGGMFRGRCYGIAIVDGPFTDADFAAVAQGADPREVFANWRTYIPMVENGEISTKIYTNGILHPGGDLVVHSTKENLVVPGRSFDRLNGMVASPQKALCIVPLHWPHREFGRIIFDVETAYTSGVAEIRMVEMAEDGRTGKVIWDWFEVGPMAASITIDTKVPPMTNGQIHGRLKGSDDWFVLRDNVHCEDVIVNDSQSQRTFALSNLNDQGRDTNSGADVVWDNDEGRGFKFVRRAKDFTATNDAPGFILGRTNPHFFGGGFVAYCKQLSKRLQNATYIFTGINGTTVRDQLIDGGVRDMAEMNEIITEIVSGVGPDGLPNVTFADKADHSSDSITEKWDQMYKPYIKGVPDGDYITQIDDYLMSGKTISPIMGIIVWEPSRALDEPAPDERFSDARNEHERRAAVRSGARAEGVFVGPPTDVHMLDGFDRNDPIDSPGVFRHPDPDDIDGANLYQRIQAEGHAGLLGLGQYDGQPAYLLSDGARFTDATRTAFTAKLYMPIGGILKPFKAAGTSVLGFEVDGVREEGQFDVVIQDNETFLFTKQSGAWPQGVQMSFKIGGPGDYGKFDVISWLEKSPVYGEYLFVQGVDAPITVADA